MPLPEDLRFDEANFSGVARLFPLPNLVMFPHVLQPLHVYEPRYRALLEEALDDDRLIAMAVLAPGWENDYEGARRFAPWLAWAAWPRTSGWTKGDTTCCLPA